MTTEDLAFAQVTPPDGAARSAAEAAGGVDGTVRAAAHPFGLGPIGTAAAWLAGCQGRYPPRPLPTRRVVVFAADHGIAEREVSARAAHSTAALAADATRGGMLRAYSDAAGADLRIIDVGTATGAPECEVGAPSGCIDAEDALPAADVRAAVDHGVATADAEVDSGADILVAGNLGVGATTVAATLVAAWLEIEPVAAVGRGSGIDDAGWMRKTVAVRDALRRCRPHVADPLALLRVAGGADVAALTGFLAQAAVRRTPVLLGGLTVCTAALLAEELAPGARQWWYASCPTSEPAHRLAREHLDLDLVLPVELSGDAEVAGVLALAPLLAAVTAS